MIENLSSLKVRVALISSAVFNRKVELVRENARNWFIQEAMVRAAKKGVTLTYEHLDAYLKSKGV